MVAVPANEIAGDLGTDKIANMVVLGTYLAVSKVLSVETVLNTMREKLAAKATFLPLNEAAIQAGLQVALV